MDEEKREGMLGKKREVRRALIYTLTASSKVIAYVMSYDSGRPDWSGSSIAEHGKEYCSTE